ncbi:zinc finger CCCH domain-containing protein 39-like [Telopea speciosissima]|uniref:zinc finger CCCH domain-containing protein 39-like n=1 Tax=Telopea speciosissima TaxID=54955 RepID=UPI001CC64EF6|nr:zinc finger CCCH domain-containing protein 39-like [Telopea speciosissima]
MSVPAPPRPFCPLPSFPVSGEPVGFWPQIPFDNEQAQPAFGADWTPPFKKPRNFEDNRSNSFSNPPGNPRMPPPPALNPPVCRGVNRMFFKTRPCAKFFTGACPYGDNCNFVHGPDDLRKPPPNWQEILAARAREEERAAGLWDEDQRIITRLKLCKKYCNGEECPYRDRCNFLHEDPAKFRDDPGRFRESSAISIGTTGSPVNNGSGSDHPQESNGFVNSGSDVNRINVKPFWKTRICSRWEISATCPFGDKCHFAHGQAELQKIGGHIEAEVGNVYTAPIKPLMNSNYDVSPTNTGVGTCKQQVQGKKCLLNWRAEKISRIYADWIDDVPLVRNSPSKVES